MTTPTNPGNIPSDPMAVERLRTLLADALLEHAREYQGEDGYTDFVVSAEGAPDVIVNMAPSVAFIHDVNSAGVPMRRVVAYGEWEMDPNPPKAGDRAEHVCAHVYIAANLRTDYLREAERLSAMQDRLRAAILDQIGETGFGSPAHLRLRHSLSGEGEGAPSAEAMAAVKRHHNEEG